MALTGFFPPGSPTTALKNPKIAVAIRHLVEDRHHVGIVFYNESEQLTILDLQWHFDLKESSFDAKVFAFAVPNLDDDDARSIGALCRKIARDKPKIPYGVKYGSGTCFVKEDASLKLTDDSRGLTCATFVMAVFCGVGLPLVDVATWQSRGKEDEQWQQWVIDTLRKTKIKLLEENKQEAAKELQEHMNAVKLEIGSLRYRPEDVAGACTIAKRPASFGDTTLAGRQIKNILAPAKKKK